jgi:transcriptional regulator with XRE-family HTH domain
MTQSDLAKQLGIDRAYLNGILRGRRLPGVRLAERICKVTGKNFFDLRPDLKRLMKEHL